MSIDFCQTEGLSYFCFLVSFRWPPPQYHFLTYIDNKILNIPWIVCVRGHLSVLKESQTFHRKICCFGQMTSKRVICESRTPTFLLALKCREWRVNVRFEERESMRESCTHFRPPFIFLLLSQPCAVLAQVPPILTHYNSTFWLWFHMKKVNSNCDTGFRFLIKAPVPHKT